MELTGQFQLPTAHLTGNAKETAMPPRSLAVHHALAARRLPPALPWSATLLAGLALLATGCSQGKHGAGDSIHPSKVKLTRRVEVALAEQKEVTYAVETVGVVEPERQTDIAPGVAGVVDQVLFQEGDLMDPATTVLIKIDQRRFEAELALAKANEGRAAARLALAKDLLSRANQLRDRRAVAQEELTTREQEMRIAQAELDAMIASRMLAEDQLAKSRVRPPYSGQVNERRVAVGDYVKPETVIATMADNATMRLATYVPELAAPRLKPGEHIEFTLEAVPNKKFRAKITYLSTVADPQTHMFACKGEIESPDPNTKPGMFARVRIPIEKHPEACVVPEESVRASDKGFVVYVPEKAGEGADAGWLARPRKVRLGMRRPGTVEILEGIKAGETVVTRGSEALENGAPIEFPTAPAAKPVATGG